MIIFNEAGPYITLEIIFAALDFIAHTKLE